MIVNISDIEDLIIAKYNIDKERIKNGEIDGRSNLNEFISTYANVSKYTVILDVFEDPRIVSFNIVKMSEETYLFITGNDDDIKFVSDNLEKINYDLSKLKKRTEEDIIIRIGTNEYTF